MVVLNTVLSAAALARDLHVIWRRNPLQFLISIVRLDLLACLPEL